MNKQDAISHNLDVLMDQGPRMTTRYVTYVVARDPKAGQILLGGVGGCGVGHMWTDEEPYHKDYVGYDIAPIQEWPGCWEQESQTIQITLDKE